MSVLMSPHGTRDPIPDSRQTRQPLPNMVKPSSLLGLALALASPCAVAAGFDNFPVKSTNLDKVSVNGLG